MSANEKIPERPDPPYVEEGIWYNSIISKYFLAKKQWLWLEKALEESEFAIFWKFIV